MFVLDPYSANVCFFDLSQCLLPRHQGDPGRGRCRVEAWHHSHNPKRSWSVREPFNTFHVFSLYLIYFLFSPTFLSSCSFGPFSFFASLFRRSNSNDKGRGMNSTMSMEGTCKASAGACLCAFNVHSFLCNSPRLT